MLNKFLLALVLLLLARTDCECIDADSLDCKQFYYSLFHICETAGVVL